MEDGGLISQNPSSHLSGGGGFYKEEDEKKTKRSMEGVAKFFMCKRAQSIPMTVMVRCVSSWLRHPGLTSFCLHVILVPQMKLSKSPRSGMPEGPSVFIFCS